MVGSDVNKEACKADASHDGSLGGTILLNEWLPLCQAKFGFFVEKFIACEVSLSQDFKTAISYLMFSEYENAIITGLHMVIKSQD